MVAPPAVPKTGRRPPPMFCWAFITSSSRIRWVSAESDLKGLPHPPSRRRDGDRPKCLCSPGSRAARRHGAVSRRGASFQSRARAGPGRPSPGIGRDASERVTSARSWFDERCDGVKLSRRRHSPGSVPGTIADRVRAKTRLIALAGARSDNSREKAFSRAGCGHPACPRARSGAHPLAESPRRHTTRTTFRNTSRRSAPSRASVTTSEPAWHFPRALPATTLHVAKHPETPFAGLPQPRLGEGRGKTAGA